MTTLAAHVVWPRGRAPWVSDRDRSQRTTPNQQPPKVVRWLLAQGEGATHSHAPWGAPTQEVYERPDSLQGRETGFPIVGWVASDRLDGTSPVTRSSASAKRRRCAEQRRRKARRGCRTSSA